MLTFAEGALWACATTSEGACYARVTVDGTVTTEALTSQDQLRSIDPGARTRGLNPSVFNHQGMLLRSEHYDHKSGLRERLGVKDTWVTGREIKASNCWTLGSIGDWFLRYADLNGKSKVVAVDTKKGKRSDVKVDSTFMPSNALLDGEVVRVLETTRGSDRVTVTERRLSLELEKNVKVQQMPGTQQTELRLGSLAACVPGGDLLVAEGDSLILQSTGQKVFTVPPSIFVGNYQPTGTPSVLPLTATRWLARFDFGVYDNGPPQPRCRGAIVCDGGRVIEVLYLDPTGVLRTFHTEVTLSGSCHFVAISADNTGGLAALLNDPNNGLCLFWTALSPSRDE